ncbi:MAG: glycosyltransferase family 2 protein [Coriobacteriia bacterium]|nr:glycosyltransferase family 2 protein [Coriobacteriia bacterium]
MESPRLSFLIGTKNRRDALAVCLSSIETQDYANREVVVVVDGSTDGTAEMVAERFPDVNCIALAESGGLGAALTTGLARVTGDVVINLDDDCELTTPDTATRIAATLVDNPDFDVLCFKVTAPDGSMRRREIPLRSKRMPAENTEIAYFLGGAVAFRVPKLRAAGGYPDGVRWGSWENTVSFRLARAGSRILLVPSIVVTHYAIPAAQNTGDREANYVRSELRIAATFLPVPYAQVHAFLWIAESFVAAVRNGRAGRMLVGMREGLSEWGERRSDSSERLTLEQTRRLSRLSGRTWY